MEKVAPVWKKAAIILGFDQDRIKRIEMDAHYKMEHATLEMFSLWLKGAHDLQSATWNTLIQCLNEAKLKETAEMLKNLVGYK